jgi:hypothetical protein
MSSSQTIPENFKGILPNSFKEKTRKEHNKKKKEN